MGSCSSKNTGAEVHQTANGQKSRQLAPPANAASPKSAPAQSVQTVEKEEKVTPGDSSVRLFMYFFDGRGGAIRFVHLLLAPYPAIFTTITRLTHFMKHMPTPDRRSAVIQIVTRDDPTL
eukprot:scaffold135711_cov77-Cyclotella_meneghiniana.AAC.3